MNGTSGVYYHRQYVPHAVMCDHFPDIIVQECDDILKAELPVVLKADIIVLHGRIERELVLFLAKHGKPFVYDVDDYWYCTPDRLFHSEWKHTNHGANVEYAIKAAAAVTCTSDILANYIKKHTGVVATVLPNGIAENDPQFTPVKTESTRLRFGFVGGSSHVLDIPIIARAVALLYNKYPQYRDKWQIVYGGFDMDARTMNAHTGAVNSMRQKDTPSVQIEKLITQNYELCGSDYTAQLRRYTTEPLPDDQQYRRIWTRGVRKYAGILNECDVLFCPLQDNTFNRCKSNLKVIEAGWMGKEVIASFLGTFLDGKLEGNMVLATETRDWVEAMVSHIEYFIEHGHATPFGLQAKVREHYNAKNFVQKRYELYKSIL